MDVGKKGRPECIRNLDHRGSKVLTCTFSKCGTLFASGDSEGCVRIDDVTSWNPLNSKLCRPAHPTFDMEMTKLLGHLGPERAVTCVSFGADSKMLVSASMDTTVRLWQQQSAAETELGEEADSIERESIESETESSLWASTFVIHFPGPVNFVQFAPTGMHIIANCLNDDRAYTWDVASMLRKEEAWRYEVLDCGDDKDEITCTCATWTEERCWTAIGLDSGDITLWCARPSGVSRQVSVLTSREHCCPTTVSFSPDCRYMVCTKRAKDAGVPAAEALSHVLVYDLEQLVAPHEDELQRIIESAHASTEHDVLEPSSADIGAQSLVLAYVGQSAHVWLEEVVQHLQLKMGQGSMKRFFSSRCSALSSHEIVMERSQRTIAFLSKSNRTGVGQQPGEREAEVMFVRDEAVKAMTLEPQTPKLGSNATSKPRSTSSFRGKLSEKLDVSPPVEAYAQTADFLSKQSEMEKCNVIVLDWLLTFPKLFQILWNSYVFNTNPYSLDTSLVVTSNGRVASKVSDTEEPSTLLWLNPAIHAGMDADVEFLVERWTAVKAEGVVDGLRIGVLQRDVSKDVSEPGGVQASWWHGIGNGMRFKTTGSSTLI